jgi:Ca-activated chloride channel family protein
VLRWAALMAVNSVPNSPAPGLRRRLPLLLLMRAVAATVVALARPHALIVLPGHERTVILAMDVSGSMRATDVTPSRLAAAKAVAQAIVAARPRPLTLLSPRDQDGEGVRIGVVAFADAATLAQAPTASPEDAITAIERLQPGQGTAIGSGILTALAAIPAAGAADASAAIVLLTDGQSTSGPDPVEAARAAARRGIRIYAVGVGTGEGEILRLKGWSVHARLDEKMLRRVAQVTSGEYFHAVSAPALGNIYETLTARLVSRTEHVEITFLFLAAAALTAIASALLSLYWFRRIL